MDRKSGFGGWGSGGYGSGSGSGNGFNWRTLGNLDRLSPQTQAHLGRVYQNLCITVLSAAFAFYLVLYGYLPDAGALGLLMMVACLLTASFMPNRAENSLIRHGALYGFGFTQGWTIAPLIETVMILDPNSLMMAIVGAAVIFASFSMTALNSPRREYLYLGGILASVLGVMAFSSLASMFIRSPALYSAELYLGLFVFSFYVLYDTQVIIERAEGGTYDSVLHAVTLYTDLADIFVRLLMILYRSKGSSPSRDYDERRSNNRSKQRPFQ